MSFGDPDRLGTGDVGLEFVFFRVGKGRLRSTILPKSVPGFV